MQLSPIHPDLFSIAAAPAAGGSGPDPAAAPFAQWLAAQTKGVPAQGDEPAIPPFSQFPLNWGFAGGSPALSESPVAAAGAESALSPSTPLETAAVLPKPATVPLPTLAPAAADDASRAAAPATPGLPLSKTERQAAAPLSVAIDPPALEGAVPLPVPPQVAAAQDEPEPAAVTDQAETPAEGAGTPRPRGPGHGPELPPDALAAAANPMAGAAQQPTAPAAGFAPPEGQTRASRPPAIAAAPKTGLDPSAATAPAGVAAAETAGLVPPVAEREPATAGSPPPAPEPAKPLPASQANPSAVPSFAPRLDSPAPTVAAPTVAAPRQQNSGTPAANWSAAAEMPRPQGWRDDALPAQDLRPPTPLPPLQPLRDVASPPRPASDSAPSAPLSRANLLEPFVPAPVSSPPAMTEAVSVSTDAAPFWPQLREPSLRPLPQPVAQVQAAAAEPVLPAPLPQAPPPAAEPLPSVALLTGLVPPPAAAPGTSRQGGQKTAPLWSAAAALEPGAEELAAVPMAAAPPASRPIPAVDGQGPRAGSLSDRRFAELFAAAPAAPPATAGKEAAPLPASTPFAAAAGVPLAPAGLRAPEPESATGPGPLALGPHPGLAPAPHAAAPAPAATLSLPSGLQLPEQEVVNQVFSQIQPRSEGGIQRLTLRLNPEELGEVRLELSIEKSTVRAHLAAQSQQVQEVLEKHLPRLREAFELQGLKLQELQVSVDSGRDGGRSLFQHSQQQWQHHSPAFAGANPGRRAPDLPISEPLAPVAVAPASGGLSLRV